MSWNANEILYRVEGLHGSGLASDDFTMMKWTKRLEAFSTHQELTHRPPDSAPIKPPTNAPLTAPRTGLYP